MSPVIIALLIWLHQLATVVWIGQLLLTGLIYMPLFAEQLKAPALGNMIRGMAKRAAPWIWASVVIFIITGVAMTLGKTRALGLTGFGHPWVLLILIKHVIVVVMIILAVYMQRVALPGLVGALTPEGGPAGPPPEAAGEGPLPGPPPHVQAAIQRSRRTSMALMICGIVVLLLTAIAEAL